MTVSIEQAKEAFNQRDRFGEYLASVFSDEGFDMSDTELLKRFSETLILSGWIDIS